MGLRVNRDAAWPFGFGFAESFKFSEYPDRMLAMIACGGAEFVEEESFLVAGGLAVPEKDGFGVFFF